MFFHYPSILVCKRMCKNPEYWRTPHLRHSYESWKNIRRCLKKKRWMKLKTHWSTLKEFDCIIQTQNCVGGHVSLSWYSYSGWLWPFTCYSNREENFWRRITSQPFKLWPLNLVTSAKNYFRKSSWRIRLHWRKHANQVLAAMFFKSCIFLKSRF